MRIQTAFWQKLLEKSLKEDGLPWDWTAIGTTEAGAVAQARVVAKSDGIWAADGLLEYLPEAIRCQAHVKDGTVFKAGTPLLQLEGSAREILAYERSILNLAAYAGGIAWKTRKLVDLVCTHCPENPPRVTATRKILPLYKDLALHAIQVGGGHSHRVNLAGGILIKENHIVCAGSVARAIESCKKIAPHGLKIEIEVKNLAEVKEATASGAEAVLLDNFSPGDLRSALSLLRGTDIVVEASGGITLDNVKDYALPGVHLISSGGLTHSVISLDFSLLIDECR